MDEERHLHHNVCRYLIDDKFQSRTWVSARVRYVYPVNKIFGIVRLAISVLLLFLHRP